MSRAAFSGLLLLCACGENAPPALADVRVELAAPVVADVVAGVRLPVIEMELGGRSRQRFLVDSGSETTLVVKTRARELGLGLGTYSGTASTTGSSGTSIETDHYACIDELRLGELRVARCRAVAFDSPVLDQMRLAGILGQDLLRRLVVVVDMQRRKVHFLPASFRQEQITAYLREAKLGSGAWSCIDAGYRPCPFFPLTIADLEGEPVQIEIDTGATDTSLPGRVIDALGLRPSGRARLTGVSGTYESATYRLEQFGLFGYRLDLDIHRTPLAHGLLGMNVLRHFVVVLDGPGDSLWMHHRRLDRDRAPTAQSAAESTAEPAGK